MENNIFFKVKLNIEYLLSLLVSDILLYKGIETRCYFEHCSCIPNTKF